MNKKIKQILKGSIIFISTLVIGFSITAISFNLFDALTQNQMRILFAADIIILLITGSVVWGFFNSKKIRLEKEKQFIQRHNSRIQEMNERMESIEMIISKDKFAA